MCAVIRGDVHTIRIGPYTNVQDNCVIHVFKEQHPTVIADHVTIGHSATVHGCRIDAYCLIGMGATILNEAHVGEECVVAAGSLVPEGMVIPPRSLVMGVPAKFRRQVTEEERQGLRQSAANYFEYKETYLAELKRP
jgi:carbonic anhydrase/acetyltransferase-like protein (isoleucine patch superfamily)